MANPNEKVRKALLVFLLTDTTRAWLKANDPKGLEQAEQALKGDPLLEDFLAREADKPAKDTDFQDRHILRAGRMLLGWSGLGAKQVAEIDQFLDAVDKSTAPEACADVVFAITGESNEEFDEDILDLVREHDPEDEVSLCELALRRLGVDLTLDKATRYMEKAKSDGEEPDAAAPTKGLEILKGAAKLGPAKGEQFLQDYFKKYPNEIGPTIRAARTFQLPDCSGLKPSTPKRIRALLEHLKTRLLR